MRLQPLHWAGRFVRTLLPARLSPTDRRWVESLVSEREAALFVRMSNADRSHAVRVARAVEAELQAAPGIADGFDRRDVLVAALMHDVGKTIAGLGTYGRVIATLSGVVGGVGMADHWQQTQGFTRRVGLYLRYPELGAELLEVAESAPIVVAWSRDHHRDPSTWTVPVELGQILVRCDR